MELLEQAYDNAKHITRILMEIDKHIPETDKPVTDDLFTELQRRMLYQDTLYDLHGSLKMRVINRDIMENIETFDKFSDIMSHFVEW
jgi:hypothetical protein